MLEHLKIKGVPLIQIAYDNDQTGNEAANFLAQKLSESEVEACEEPLGCREGCLRGYEIQGLLPMEQPNTDHQSSIIQAAWPFLRDLVETWLSSD